MQERRAGSSANTVGSAATMASRSQQFAVSVSTPDEAAKSPGVCLKLRSCNYLNVVFPWGLAMTLLLQIFIISNYLSLQTPTMSRDRLGGSLSNLAAKGSRCLSEANMNSLSRRALSASNLRALSQGNLQLKVSCFCFVR